MQSIFANLFLLLQAKLATIANGEQPAFRHIDFDMGQLDEETPPITYPAILIDFDQFNWQDMAENCKIGEGPITLKLVFAPYSGTSNITNPTFREKGLTYFELEKKVKSALDGWCPDGNGYSPLDYESVTTDKSRTDLRVRAMTFSIGIEDYSDQTTFTKTPFTPNINTQLQ